MADFTVEGIVRVDVSRGIRDLTRFQKKLKDVKDDLRSVDRAIKDIDGSRVRIDVDADGVEQVKAQIEELDQKKAEVEVDLEKTEFMKDLAEIDAVTNSIKDSIYVEAELNGKKALRDAAELNEELDALLDEHKTVKVDVDRDSIDSLGLLREYASNAAASIAGSGRGSLISAIVLLITTIGPLAAVVSGVSAGVVGALGTMSAGFGAFAIFAIPTIAQVTAAIKDIDKATKGLTGDEKLEAFNAALGNVDKTIRPIVRKVYELKQVWGDLAKDLAGPISEAMTSWLDVAISGLKRVAPVVDEVAAAIKNLADRTKESLDNNLGDWANFFNYVEENVGQFIRQWGRAFGNILTGIANLIVAFDPLSKWVSRGFLRMSQDFLNWSRALDENKGFKKFVAYVKKEGPGLAQLFGRIVIGLIQLAINLAPIGEKTLTALNGFLGWYNAWSKANPELAKLVTSLAVLGTVLAPFLGLITGLIGPLVSAAVSIGSFAAEAAVAAGAAAGLSSGIAGLVAVAVGLAAVMAGVVGYLVLTTDSGETSKRMWKNLKRVWGELKDTGSFLKDLFLDMVQALKDSGTIERFQSAFADLADAFVRLLPVIKPIAIILGTSMLAAIVGLSFAFQALAHMIDQFAMFVEAPIRWVADLFQWLWEFLVGHSVVPDIVNGIIEWFAKLPTRLLGIVTRAVQNVATGFLNMKTRVIAIGGQIVTAGINFMTRLVSNVTSKATTLVSNARTKFGELRTAVVEKLNLLKTKAVEIAGNIVSGVKTELDKVKGKVTGAFTGAGTWLYDAGASLISGLINGITSKIGSLAGKMGEVAGMIGDFLPGSPIKDGPLKARGWNQGRPGKMLMENLAKGIRSSMAPKRAIDEQASLLAGLTGTGSLGFATAGGIAGGAFAGTGRAAVVGNGAGSAPVDQTVVVKFDLDGRTIKQSTIKFDRRTGRPKVDQ